VKEATSAGLALQFRDKGYTKVYALRGGWKEWQKAGFPTEKR
jgi:rhodanese-related sulfurtransferase